MLKTVREECEALRTQIVAVKSSLFDITLPDAARQVKPITDFRLKQQHTLRGHRGKVYSCEFSHDNKLLASVAQDGFIIIWDVYTSNKVDVIPLANSWVLTCTYSPSGRFVASGGLDNACTVYRVNTASHASGNPRALCTFKGHAGYVSACKFRGENQVITSSGDLTCMLWDVNSGKKLQEFIGHLGAINSISINPQNSHIFSSSSCDGMVKLWDIRTNNCIQNFASHQDDVNSVEFFPDGNAIGTGSDDTTCRLFDLRADCQLSIFTSPNTVSGVSSISFSRSGRLLFAGYENGECQVWDVLRGDRVSCLNEHSSKVSNVTVSSDGICISTASWDSTIKIWSTT
ncbi:G protein beta 2 subunit [Nadsonia fulvescens var. elongata DSM 6958]|uniref:G protein beta 2 subunit n=1 Tax=Nadsonia fulvescens var. elongata DSM 6958 TaxID=857566 RepID=A0A1E3PRW0_9ASCO|nr:G protein beta 2 subunit [Nadsonia fulvescens var. elongata DSM 6958]